MRTLILTLCLLIAGLANARAESSTRTLPMVLQIEPVEVLQINSGAGSNVHLRVAGSGFPSQAEAVEVVMASNTGSRYQIFHEVAGDLTSQSGTSLSPETVQFRVISAGGQGQSLIPSYSPLPQGRVPIYESSGSGADRFVIEYSAANERPVEAGNYLSRIMVTYEQI